MRRFGPLLVRWGSRIFGRFCRGGCSYGGICVLADATWDPIAWRLNNDFSRSLRHCRWNFSSPVTEKIVLLHPKIHCLMRKGFALSTSSFSIPATPPSPHRIRSKRPPRGPFPYFCRHKKSSELWRIKKTSCQRNSYLKQSRKTHPSTRISRKKHYKKYCISWSHSYV